MTKDDSQHKPQLAHQTALTQLGRKPFDYYGFVNTPIFRGSTVLFPNAEALETRARMP